MIRDLNLQLYHHDFKFDKELNLKHPLSKAGTEYYRSRITNPMFAVYVADQNGKLVGYVIGSSENKFRYRKGITGELENMFVLPIVRRQGVGRFLVKKLAVWLKSRQVDRIYVSAYIKSREAVAFYQAIGFKPWEMGLEMNVK